MKRVVFDASGKIAGVDGKEIVPKGNSKSGEWEEEKFNGEHDFENFSGEINNDDIGPKEIAPIKDDSFWNLYDDSGKAFLPLKFSNGKTQEDVVREVVDLIHEGKKIIFVHGTCGTGKSAIALNVARKIGRASIVVPIKSLQRQYENDYMKGKYLLKGNGKKMKISMITGRDNHDSVFVPGVSCADQFLPDTIKFSEKNARQIREFYQQNPIIKHKIETPDVRHLRRISIAPTNPYWSPIVNSQIELKQLGDAKKKRYMGLQNKEFIFYHRKEGCTYYDQYQAYIDADVIIFNSAKYKIETLLDRKPATAVEIIDESDEFLDSFSSQEELNITRLIRSLQHISVESESGKKARDKIIELLELEEKQKKTVGIDEDKIFPLHETYFGKIFRLLTENSDLQIEISLDEMSYANKGLEIAFEFADLGDETYVNFYRREDSLIVGLATASISKQFKEMLEKNKAFVFMSGTIHSPEVLKHIFGLEDYAIVDAEKIHQGTIEIHRTGKEFDCRYSNFKQGNKTRKDYLLAMKACLDKAKRPVLVHVNAFEDLPSEFEVKDYSIPNLPAREQLKEKQGLDKEGKMVLDFKQKKIAELFTTKCSRGIDFPGEVCNSIVFTKYPNPNVNETFWKVLQQTHSEYYWEFYRDKARREFLQRIYRAVRSKEDHVFVLSPDARVLDAVRDLQLMQKSVGKG